MVVNLLSETRQPVITRGGFDIQPEDIANQFLGYVSVFYTDRVFSSPDQEATSVKQELISIETQIRQAENKRTAALVSPLPFLAIKYQKQVNDLVRRRDALAAALVTLNENMSAAEQAARENTALQQVFSTTPAGGAGTLTTAENLIRAERAKWLVEQAAQTKKTNTAAAFLIPAAVGAAAGFFL